MSTSKRLIEATKDIWDSYYTHPFIKEIANGTLDKEKFSYYMIQDYLYLFQYSKVFALGVLKARDEATMAYFSGVLNYVLNGEMEIHRGYMKRLGITKEQIENATAELDNISYTSYMLEVGSSGSALDVFVAVFACAVSYAYIGKYILENGGDINHEFYGDWIKAYSSEDYQKTNLSLIEMVDKACEGISEKEYKRLEEIMINCSKYEYLFWDFSYNSGK